MIRRMSASGRWSLLALVAVIALIVALWPRHSTDDAGGGGASASMSASSATARTDPALRQARAAAGLAACPQPSGAAPAASAPLTDIRLDCLADGRPVDLAAALAGKPALLNVWAYWCAPCAEELPQIQAYAARAGGAVTVLTVHSDPNEAAGLSRLASLSVRLPGVQDSAHRVGTAVGAPNVLPYSVLLRPDGTVAEVAAKPFYSVDEIAAEVHRVLGVAA